MEESAHFANATECNGRKTERHGRKRREIEPTPDCCRGGGWECVGMGGSSSGGGALTPARDPTCQILIIIQLPMFESFLKLLFPIPFHASLHYSECSVVFRFQI